MADETTDQETPEAPDSGSSRGTFDAVRGTLRKRDSRGRPVAVYGILGLGVATLLALMLVVYLWSSDRGKPDRPICTTTNPERAALAVRDGQVEQLTITFDGQVDAATDQAWGPVQARLDYVDGQCGYLPQGIANQPALLEIVGAVTFYNETTDSRQVEVVYAPMTDLDPVLFAPPTAIPTEVPVVSPEVSPTDVPTETPTGGPATPSASPAAPPRIGPPLASPTPS